MAGKPTAEEKKAAKAQKRAASKQRRAQIWQAFQMQRREDKLLIPIMLGVFLAPIVILSLIGFLFFASVTAWTLAVLGVAIGIMAAIAIFGRRVQRSVYTKADGQPGAAGWALDNLRGQWRVAQGIAGTTHLDAVHRVIGRPGIIFVAEGAPHRVKQLLAQEKKRTARVAGKTPIYDVTVGHEEGQIPLKNLQKHLMKLPRNITAAEMDTLESKLTSLGNRSAALPKGPMPAGAKMRSVQRTVRRR
ncbi:uncharacterized protein DUF4191 [Pseudonocardia sediminis]|uniref:Uncharacterized protein DUF4191 n=1 Tax=Pseudonocardia sediminis TaxID=1397368 RepID=A0A4Q7V120_PSEST|nr:DUF4191 domain-containing protein [Pseudonocardia sediminis]RZT87011.1 uncharacterized protein DUF4191 [Pseudonocardia sediminis]